jgi:hypothetical protein
MATLITFSPSTTAKSADVNANFTALANGSAMTTPTFDAMSATNLKQVSGFYDNGNSGSSITINWANGDRQKLTMSAACTISFSGALSGQVLLLYLVENGTGGFTPSFPTLKWPQGSAGTATTTAGAINLYAFFYDGTNYLAQLQAGFA